MMHDEPQVGDWACHRTIDLDPRQVTEVSEDGQWVKLRIIVKSTDWLPVSNYGFSRRDT